MPIAIALFPGVVALDTIGPYTDLVSELGPAGGGPGEPSPFQSEPPSDSGE